MTISKSATFGSDSFYIEVDHGPIQNMNNVEIVVPIIDTDDSEASTDKLQIISFSHSVDDTCQDCRVRIGVVTMPTDGDEPTPLDPRISVLGISYEGSERFALTAALSCRAATRSTLHWTSILSM